MAMMQMDAGVPVAPLGRPVGVHYLVPISWNGREYQTVLDTRGADTWLIAPDYMCLDDRNFESPHEVCNFGALYDQEIELDSTYTFMTSYSGGGGLVPGTVTGGVSKGPLGVVEMSIAGITVPQQLVGLVKESRWDGDGIASGLCIPHQSSSLSLKAKTSQLVWYVEYNATPLSGVLR
jgi:hypothetical protein